MRACARACGCVCVCVRGTNVRTILRSRQSRGGVCCGSIVKKRTEGSGNLDCIPARTTGRQQREGKPFPRLLATAGSPSGEGEGARLHGGDGRARLTHLLHKAVLEEEDARGRATGINALDLNPGLLFAAKGRGQEGGRQKYDKETRGWGGEVREEGRSIDKDIKVRKGRGTRMRTAVEGSATMEEVHERGGGVQEKGISGGCGCNLGLHVTRRPSRQIELFFCLL